MKIFAVILLVLTSNSVFAKNDNLVFRPLQWLALTGNAVVVNHLPHRLTPVRESDIGAVIYCRFVDGRVRGMHVLTREKYEDMIERSLGLYCDNDELRVNGP